MSKVEAGVYQRPDQRATQPREPGRTAGPAAARAVGATPYSRLPQRSGPRSARLVLRRLAPLSVLRWALAASVAFLIVALATVATLYALLDAMGVFATIGRVVHDLGLASSTTISALPVVLTWTAIAAAGLAVLFTIVVTVAAVLFNVINDVVGGPQLTLTEHQ